MVESPVTITADGISVELLALLNIDSLKPESMPLHITGWLKRTFDPTEMDGVLSGASGKTMWFFGERFNYDLKIKNRGTLSFHAIRGERQDQMVHQSSPSL